MAQPANPITKDTKVGEMVEKYPRTVNIMLSHGLHCVGCGVSPYETIENGALGHGLAQEEVVGLLAELNEIASAPPRSTQGIHFTERAINKVKELAIAENKMGQTLKIQVTPAGCDGWEYFMDFASQPAQDEKETGLAGLNVYISEASEKALQGAEIDYLVTPEGEGFKIDNPNKPACECGGCGRD